MERAESILIGGRGDFGRLRAVRRRRDALELSKRLEEVRLEMAAVEGHDFDEGLGDRRFGEAFRAAGLDPWTLTADDLARRLPTGPLRADFVAGLDPWGMVRRARSRGADESWKRIMAAAR